MKPFKTLDEQVHLLQERGLVINPACVDLGIAAVNHKDMSKGNFVVMNQIRTISKLRIESPKTSKEPRKYVDKDKFSEILDKLNRKTTP